MNEPVVLRALAKLTLSLRITGIRPDGYHLIDAEMVTIDLHDVVTIAPGDGLIVKGRYAAGIPTDDRNLVRRALRAIGRTATVTVDKAIPAGAGLGGGSADAAAVLRWADCRDTAIAAAIGADVPFALQGGRALVHGIGDEIDPLPFLDQTFTLVTPPLAIATVDAYRAWDALGGPVGQGANDLEPAALAAEPQLAAWRDRIGDACGFVPVLAGSGSTWFVAGAHPDLAGRFPDAMVAVTRTDRP
ncbi:MAG: 4-(cytidine 5'-diphospho)-2-C-methyl-D-erythritol kinase [Acidimicrobiales bacterium]